MQINSFGATEGKRATTTNNVGSIASKKYLPSKTLNTTICLMFTMAKIKDGSTYLKRHLSANDYYSEGESTLGSWIGKGSETLEIANNPIAASDEAFELLRKNLHPKTKEKLTQRMVENRVCFFDFQCSAPKSISVMGTMMEDPKIIQAHRESVLFAFQELEKFASKKSRENGEQFHETTGNLIAAQFHHDSSRALDPQLHTHLVIANATFSKNDQKWYGLETESMVKAIRYCGKVYTNELAKKVQAIGYDIVEKRDKKGNIISFELACITDEEISLYSKRRKEVEKGITEFVAKYGRPPTPLETHDITVKTRDKKLAEISTPEVRLHQRNQLSPERIKTLESIKDNKISKQVEDKTAFAFDYAMKHIFERLSVAKKYEVFAEALNSHLGSIDLEALKAQIKTSKIAKTIQPHSKCDLLALVSTFAIFRHEEYIINSINRALNKAMPLRIKIGVDLTGSLNEDQKKAYKGVLHSRSNVTIIRGAAGTGKSHTLKTLQKAFEISRTQPFYLAPTTSAAADLKADGLPYTTTLSDFLKNGRKNYKDSLQKSFIVLDEAGLASTFQMSGLLELANDYDARILLVGDNM